MQESLSSILIVFGMWSNMWIVCQCNAAQGCLCIIISCNQFILLLRYAKNGIITWSKEMGNENTTLWTMPGHAKSKTKNQQIKMMVHKEALVHAMKLHQEDKGKPEEQRQSLQVLCWAAENEMKQQKKKVSVSHVTLKRWLKGGRSCQQANKENHGWLIPKEETSLIIYCLELAPWGFPLTHKILKSHIDFLLHAWLGSAFPKAGMGQNWINHFLECP